jgi:DNA-directed RNA polymerase subunit RPC12/RpoP
MTARQMELLPKPARKPRRVLMQVCDAGHCEGHIAQFRCGKCGHVSDWLRIASVTEGKRGVACPRCN